MYFVSQSFTHQRINKRSKNALLAKKFMLKPISNNPIQSEEELSV